MVGRIFIAKLEMNYRIQQQNRLQSFFLVQPPEQSVSKFFLDFQTSQSLCQNFQAYDPGTLYLVPRKTPDSENLKSLSKTIQNLFFQTLYSCTNFQVSTEFFKIFSTTPDLMN